MKQLIRTAAELKSKLAKVEARESKARIKMVAKGIKLNTLIARQQKRENKVNTLKEKASEIRGLLSIAEGDPNKTVTCVKATKLK